MSFPDDAMTRRFPADLQRAQRNLDADLIKTMHNMARTFEKRSAKLATVLRMGADRIQALSIEVDQLRYPAPQLTENQPASAPAP